MKTPFLTPKQANEWLAAQPVPTPQVDIPTPGMDLGGLKLGLYGAGAVLLGIVGWLTH